MKRLALISMAAAALLLTACGGGTLFANGGTTSGSSGSANGSGGPVSTPTITSFSPVAVDAGALNVVLTVNGSGFESGAVVTFNGDPETTTFVSVTELTAAIKNADLLAGGPIPVTVANPDGGAASGTYGVVNPPPVIQSLSPTSLPAGSTPSVLTVTGTGLNASTVVTFAGSPHAATVASPTQLTILLTGGDLAAAAVAPVVATNPAPGGGSSAPVNFLINNPAPAITSFAPASLPQGSPGQGVLINGSGFVNGSGVLWNGSAAGATFLSATQLSLALTSADLAQSGFQTVQITNPTPGGGLSASAGFAVNGPAPSVASVTPAAVVVGAAATLTVYGSNFAPAATVAFGSPIETYTPSAVAPAQLTVTLPASALTAAGSFPLTVTNPAPGGGSATLSGGLPVQNPAVVLTSMLPVSAPLDEVNPVPVTLGGSGFVAGVSTVTFNGSPVADAVVNSAGQITFNLQPSQLTQSGILPIAVTNSAPCAASSCASNPLYFSVGAPASTPAGIAVVAQQVKQLAGGFQTQDVAYVPLPAPPGATQAEVDVVQLDTIDLPPFLPVNGLVTNAAPYLTPGVANGVFVNVPETAPGPNGFAGTPVLNRILLPAGFVPGITVADPSDNQILVASIASPLVYAIALPAAGTTAPDPASQTITGSLSLAAFITAAPIEFSDYLCSGVCSLVVDQSGIAAHNVAAGSTEHARALAMTPSGLVSFDAVTGAQLAPCLNAACGVSPGPDFAYSSTGSSWNALNPFYLPNNTLGLQFMTFGGSGAITSLTIPIGTRPASAVIDPSTQLGLVTDEGTGVNTLVNLFQPPATLPASLSVPSTSFYIGAGSTYCSGRPDWTMTALDAGTHLALSAQEFAGCMAVTQLPSSPVVNGSTGATATPAAPQPVSQLRFGLTTAPQGPYQPSPPWGQISSGLDPDGLTWSNGFDPYKFAVYTSVLTGQPTALMLEPQLTSNPACSSSVPGVWIAETPLASLLNAPSPSGIGEISPTGMAQIATFLRLRTPAPAICGPAQVAQGTTVTAVTITGAGFVGATTASYAGTAVNFSGTTVTWDGTSEVISALTPSSITFSVTPAQMSIGAHTITVTMDPNVYGSIGGTSSWTIQVVPASSTGT